MAGRQDRGRLRGAFLSEGTTIAHNAQAIFIPIQNPTEHTTFKLYNVLRQPFLSEHFTIYPWRKIRG